MNTYIDQQSNAGEYVQPSYWSSYTFLFFIVVVILAFLVMYKFYNAKKMHIL